MPTIKLVASTYSVSNNTVTVSSASNMYTDVDSTTYATITHTTSGTTSYYCYIKGFNFSDVPSDAVVNSIVIRIRGRETNLSTSTSYAPRLYNNTSTISGASAASSNFNTNAATITVPYTGTWDTLKGYGADLGIRVVIRRSSRNRQGYLYIYGAEIEVDYTLPTPVAITGVSLDQHSASIEVGDTLTLTETVSPANASNKNVTWSSNNTSVATVSNGIVTGVAVGSARITVATVDGGFTDYCDVTVTQPVFYDYVQTDTLLDGEQYLVVSGNSGSVYIMSGEANGSGELKGIAATITNGTLSITGGTANKCLFTCAYETSGDSSTPFMEFGSNYLYADSSGGLRVTGWMSSMPGRHWHYKAENKHLLWFCNDASAGNDGYTDTSTLNKYYLDYTNGIWTAPYVRNPSLADTTTPPVYLFILAPQPTETMYTKVNGSWETASKVYKKINGSWVEQSDLSQVFDPGTNYKMVEV